MTVVGCTQCGATFASRNALFRHLREEHQDRARPSAAPAEAAEARDSRMAEALACACAQAVARHARKAPRAPGPQLGWLVADAKVRSPLASWLRHVQETPPTSRTPEHLQTRHRPRTPMWWVVLTLELHAFLARRPAHFALATVTVHSVAGFTPCLCV